MVHIETNIRCSYHKNICIGCHPSSQFC